VNDARNWTLTFRDMHWFGSVAVCCVGSTTGTSLNSSQQLASSWPGLVFHIDVIGASQQLFTCVIVYCHMSLWRPLGCPALLG
jgi:hypothetical protein